MNGSLRLAAALILAAGVAACGNGALSGIPASSLQAGSTTEETPQWQATHSAYPACGGPRTGDMVQCDALIESAPGSISPDAVGGLGAPALETAYELPSKTKGKGQIVAIVDAYDNPRVESDLAVYRKQYHLGTAKFVKYNQKGEKGHYPSGNGNWGGEIDVDVEMVSASCPLCTIYLIEANDNSTGNMYAAEKEAVKLGARIVTNSWGGGAGGPSDDAFDASGVTYLASAGDYGYGMQDPADYDTVISVGGTNLNPIGKNKYVETVWVDTGAGCSVTAKPSWQSDPDCARRTGNDITAVAWNVPVYDNYQYSGWGLVGGTSISSPLMAGVIALAGNAKKQHGGKNFWLLSAKEHADDFHTHIPGKVSHCPKRYVKTYLCKAETGQFGTYSGPTGWGSPKGIAGF